MNPRFIIFSLGMLAMAASAPAFDFGSLSKALPAGVPGSDKVSKAVDTAQDVGKVVKGVAGIGPEEEKVIGDSVALEIIGHYGGLVRDQAVMDRVNFVGRSLARYSARPELSWRFGVLDSDTINAFSAPAGYVFITRGLYELADTDDALAGILAHEISHITGKHALNIVAKGDALAGATSQLVKRSSDLRVVDSQLQQFDIGVGKITKTLFEQGYSAPTEYDADKTARDLAAVTGYAPGGLRGVLTVLQRRGSNAAQKVFSTHPPLNERLKRLPADVASSTANILPPGKTKGSTSKVSEEDEAFANAAKP